MTDTAALDLRDVGFRYPDGHRGLDGLTLRVEAGERIAVLGPNGAGKSTLCLHLNGILRPQHGTVTVCGIRLPAAGPQRGRDDRLVEARRRVGLVFQDPDDQLFMPTVAADVAFGPANMGLPVAQVHDRVRAALEMVGMDGAGERAPHHLSFGQRKRVATATVLSMDPQVLVLDEPSSNLDPRGRREFADILRKLDLTVVMVTHDLPYALELCERAVVIDEGRVVADGPIRQLLADDTLLAAHALELPAGFSLAALPS